MERTESIQALEHRFPVDAPAIWSDCTEDQLIVWCRKYAILSQQERNDGVISVESPLTHHWEKMYPKGIGAYPWHCERSETHPNAMVYLTEDQRGWETIVDYHEICPGYFKYKEWKS